jgi:hypothetical protein
MRGWIGVQVNPMAEVLADSFGMTDSRKPPRSSCSPSTSWHQVMTSLIRRHASFEDGSCYALARQFVSRLLIALAMLVPACATAGTDEQSGKAAVDQVREEIWAIPSIIPMLAYMIRPIGDGPFPLVVMNHGVSLNPKERSYFPAIEFRDAGKRKTIKLRGASRRANNQPARPPTARPLTVQRPKFIAAQRFNADRPKASSTLG